jgi:hypothetical protein
VLRKGVLPRVSFPLLAELSKDRQKRSTTARGNRIGPPNDVAFMQRRQLVDFVEKKLRCERHSKRLRFCATKSHQVGVCASWCFVCEQGCLLDLRTSKSMHGNDYELNALTNCGIVTCALSFARMEPFFRLLGVNPISTTDHYAFKADVEPILGAMAERSMAREHEHAVTKGDTDFFSIDGGFTAPRLAHGCTMPAMVEGGGIVAVVHKRLTDEGATSSNSLEILCYVALLACPRLAIYRTVVMDGCKALVEPTLASHRRAQGEMWHVGKNWAKWFDLALAVLCRAQKAPALPPNPSVPRVDIDPSRQESFGERDPGETALDHVRRRIRELGGAPPEGESSPAKLKVIFGELARLKVMTSKEREQHKQREWYLEEKRRRDSAGGERAARKQEVAAAKKEGMAWKSDLRRMLRYVAEYTKSLRGSINPASNPRHEWTDGERATEFLRLWRRGGCALILGEVNDPTLKTLKHPLTEIPGEEGVLRRTAWKPKGSGHVPRVGFLFNLLYSIIHDPVWDKVFPMLIDARMTWANESFFHILRKWGTKHSHFSRYYSLAIWCSILSWNENVHRTVLEHVWKTTKGGQLRTSAGRAYRVPVRAPQTDDWRGDFWALFKSMEAAPARSGPSSSSDAIVPKRQGLFLGWYGEDPPQRPRSVPVPPPANQQPQEAQPAVEDLNVSKLKAELTAMGLPAKGKKDQLVEALRAARLDPAAAQAAREVAMDRRACPPAQLPREMERASPMRRRQTATNENDSRIVQPSFKLPSPYRLPAAQRQKRKPPAEGTRKYTTKAVSRAMDLLAQGGQASPRKRRVGVTDEQAQREAEAAEAAEVAAAGDEDLVEEESPADSLDGSDEDEDMD